MARRHKDWVGVNQGSERRKPWFLADIAELQLKIGCFREGDIAYSSQKLLESYMR